MEMIAANELRIGNWVLPEHNIDGDYHQVKILRDEGTINDTVESWYSPIPLTPEILEKCGFERHYETTIGDVEYIYEPETLGLIITNENKDWYYWNHSGLLQDPSIEYLHQLQNLIFAMTGEELTVNL